LLTLFPVFLTFPLLEFAFAFLFFSALASLIGLFLSAFLPLVLEELDPHAHVLRCVCTNGTFWQRW
jgi:hypothetical protein